MDGNVPKRVKYTFPTKLAETPTKCTQKAPPTAPSIVHIEQTKVKYGFSKTPKVPENTVQVTTPSQVKYGFSKTTKVPENTVQVTTPSQVKYSFKATTSPSQVKYGFSKAPNVSQSIAQVTQSQVKYGFKPNVRHATNKVATKRVANDANHAAHRPTVEDDAQTFRTTPVRAIPIKRKSKDVWQQDGHEPVRANPRKRKLKDVGQQDVGNEGGRHVEDKVERTKEESLDEIQAMAVQLALKQSVLILGEGGTGKSFLFERLLRDLGNKLMVVKTAPTGSAALRIGGKTVHSWAGVGRADKDVHDLVRFVKRSRWATARWADVDVLILDEISMVSAELLDKLDQVGRAVRKNDAPFGGIRVVASGDFLQLQPVNGEFCFGAACFDDLFPEDSRVVLTRNFRQANDKLFQRILTNMRAGSLTDEDIQALQSRVGAKRSGQALYVYATNAEVNHMNTAKLAATTGTSRVFKHEFVQFHSMSADDAARLEAELSNAPCVDILKLKICARVMLIVNKKFSRCSPKVNGSTGLVTNFDAQGNPEVRFDDGDVCTVMKHSWFTSCKKMSRTQYPLVLAWAVTIHKMQGATIPHATLILNLGSHIFSPCQAYVALSRACSLDQVVLEDFDAASVRSNPEAIAFCTACMQAQQKRLVASSKASPKDSQ